MFAKEINKGEIEVTYYYIIPLLLFISKSTLVGKKGKGYVWALHITPFFALGPVWPDSFIKSLMRNN